MSTQRPLQFVWPDAQLCVHVPPTQTCPPMHTNAHAPQLVGSFVVSAQIDPQAICPVGQFSRHPPPMQRNPGSQALPQLPQLFASLNRSAQ